MKRVSISTLGCKTNQFESAAMSEQLECAGYHVVSASEVADIYIINSCSVTARTDAETRRLIRRARRINPSARIVATGCYAQVAPGELEQMPELDCVLGNREKQDIASLLESSGNRVADIAAEQEAGALSLSSFAEHTRAFLQIQNGCNSFCAYCIVPYARGRSRSVTPEDVMKGVRSLADNGFKEVVLTGIHLGAYGLDLSPRTSLTELVRQIAESTVVSRLRIGSIEPNELTDELLNLMAGSAVICPHLHLPLQSGSDTVLERMGRHYTADFFGELVTRASVRLPDAFIGVDVIAGFPGETDSEFGDTLSLLEKLPVSDLHVFPYSSRPGTRAAGLPDHLSSLAIKERAARLRAVAEQKKTQFLARFMGKEVDVLIYGFDSNKLMCNGLSRNYINVSCVGKESFINRELTIKIQRCNGASCTGEISNSPNP